MWSSDLKEVDAYLTQTAQLIATDKTAQAAKTLTTAIFLLNRYFERMTETYGNDFRENIKELAEILNNVNRLSAAVVDLGMPTKNAIADNKRKKGYETRTRT